MIDWDWLHSDLTDFGTRMSRWMQVHKSLIGCLELDAYCWLGTSTDKPGLTPELSGILYVFTTNKLAQQVSLQLY